jgi:hypothetical protein
MIRKKLSRQIGKCGLEMRSISEKKRIETIANRVLRRNIEKLVFLPILAGGRTVVVLIYWTKSVSFSLPLASSVNYLPVVSLR